MSTYIWLFLQASLLWAGVLHWCYTTLSETALITASTSVVTGELGVTLKKETFKLQNTQNPVCPSWCSGHPGPSRREEGGVGRWDAFAQDLSGVEGSTGEGEALAPRVPMESVSHLHCKCFLAGCQGYAPILPFPATWLFVSLRAPVGYSHLHWTQSRDRGGHSMFVLPALFWSWRVTGM